jgi:hypothetical protein
VHLVNILRKYLELIMSQLDREDQQKLEESLQEELGFVDDEEESIPCQRCSSCGTFSSLLKSHSSSIV